MGKFKSIAAKQEKLTIAALDYFWHNPETGFREWKANEYLTKEFEALGYTLKPAGNIPGFITEIDTGKEGPTVAVFGEMDALIVPTHPDANPETGAVHACGHHAQIAALLGLAAALKENGALDGLCGKIRLVAVPAEELIEINFREDLRKKGIIHYFGGKSEFLYRGLLDGVDLAFMVHIASEQAAPVYMNAGSNGCIVKETAFKGLSSHAGGSPEKGINALYAANLAMNAANALRETFVDSDHIRFHPIITHGGDAVNAIPEKVVMESYVRGKTMKSIVNANRRINRAFAASAAAMGAGVHIKDAPGYFPRFHSEEGMETVERAALAAFGKANVDPTSWGTGCSDMGDVASVMPALHPYVCASRGKGHGNDYFITDPHLATVGSVEFQLTLLHVLLKDNGNAARNIIETYHPTFPSKEAYIAFADSLYLDQDAVLYEESKVILEYK